MRFDKYNHHHNNDLEHFYDPQEVCFDPLAINLPVLFQVSVVCYFLLLSDSLLNGYTMICLTFHQLMDI